MGNILKWSKTALSFAVDILLIWTLKNELQDRKEALRQKSSVASKPDTSSSINSNE